MKKIIGFFMLLSLLALFAGCGVRQDSIKCIHDDMILPDHMGVSYAINIGKQVRGADVVAELWTNGECEESAPLHLHDETKTMHISLLCNGDKTEGSLQELTVQIDTDTASESFLAHFALPQGLIGYAFTSYEDQEVVRINSADALILGAMAFDTGVGVRVIDCKSLMAEPERLKDYPCILILRAAFAAEEHPLEDIDRTDRK